MQLLIMGGVCMTADGVERHPQLSDFVASCDTVDQAQAVDLELLADDSGLHITWNRMADAHKVAGQKAKQKPGHELAQRPEALHFYIDVEKSVKKLRSFPAPKQGAFNQALGKKTRHVLDATGGWGGDALLMCAQGYAVTILERQPIMALLLSDAMTRLAQTEWALDNRVKVPRVMMADSIDRLSQFAGQVDCIYLDPMFPPKKKKSAAANKHMQFLQWLVGQDRDATDLVESAISNNVSRVVVKRPDYAKPLYTEPTMQFFSKLVHYDVYLTKQRSQVG